MAVTAIKAIVNASGFSLEVKDHEDPAKPGHYVANINSGEAAPCDMWVPWCNSEQGFLGAHYITIGVPYSQPMMYWLFQFDTKVMFQNVDGWRDAPRRPLAGSSEVGGDRVLVVQRSGLFLCKLGT